MSDNIFSLHKEFKDLVELRQFAEAQHRTINELTKRCKVLEEENTHLKSLLIGGGKAATDLVVAPALQLQESMTNEEVVCLTQISFLKDKAVVSALTLEEARKLEIFSKVLKEIRERPTKGNDSEIRKLSNDELLASAVEAVT